MNTEALVKEFEPIIRGIAGKLCKRTHQWNEFNDLIQTGYVALLEAASRYQTDKGASLKTFLKIRIEGAMLDEMRRNDSASRDCRRFRREQQNARRRLFIHLQREPSAHEMAYELDMPLERYRQLDKRTTATELPYPDENGNEQEPITPPTPQDNPADREQQRRDIETLTLSIDRLPQQEQLVMWDILNQTPYETIKARFQCSDSRISQIRSKGVKRLKTKMGVVA
ncbi:sigma-70 family RNA polymerase sigma factor [Endozoicomonas atrinae]|uniref:sigma-70 family RNA polymerase sigma factor n=1 Tax=Endozoicomonas atrinae TaxID=1333660 RepID=UPI003B008FD7